MNGVGLSKPKSVDNNHNWLILLNFISEMRKIEMSPAQCRYSYYIDDMVDTGIIEVLRRKFTRLASELNERGRRRWAASEALALGHGGIQVVAQATGLGERTIRRGCQDVGVKNCVTS